MAGAVGVAAAGAAVLPAAVVLQPAALMPPQAEEAAPGVRLEKMRNLAPPAAEDVADGAAAGSFRCRWPATPSRAAAVGVHLKCPWGLVWSTSSGMPR